MKSTGTILVAILLLSFPFVVHAGVNPFLPNVEKPFSYVNINGGLNSVVQSLNASIEDDIGIEAKGFSFQLNAPVGFGNIQAGVAKEVWEEQDLFWFSVENKVTTVYIGWEYPVKLPLGVSLSPGIRVGNYHQDMYGEANYGEEQSGERSNDDFYTAFSLRLNVPVFMGVGVYGETDLKKVGSFSSIVGKIHVGLSYRFNIR